MDALASLLPGSWLVMIEDQSREDAWRLEIGDAVTLDGEACRLLVRDELAVLQAPCETRLFINRGFREPQIDRDCLPVILRQGRGPRPLDDLGFMERVV